MRGPAGARILGGLAVHAGPWWQAGLVLACLAAAAAGWRAGRHWPPAVLWFRWKIRRWDRAGRR